MTLLASIFRQGVSAEIGMDHMGTHPTGTDLTRAAFGTAYLFYPH